MQGVVLRVKRNLNTRAGSRGQLLIEVLIALAILGIISVVFIGAMYTSLHAARIVDERSTAFTLAKTQMEFAKAQELRSYSPDPWSYTITTGDASASAEPVWWDPDAPDTQPALLSPEFEGYVVDVVSVMIDSDARIRRMEAVVSHNGEEVFTLYNYETDRSSGYTPPGEPEP